MYFKGMQQIGYTLPIYLSFIVNHFCEIQQITWTLPSNFHPFGLTIFRMKTAVRQDCEPLQLSHWKNFNCKL